jgi:hypothetical protein
MFQGLRQNSLFYILDKNNLTLQIGEVVSISNPMPKYGQATYPTQPFAQPDMCVDVKVKVGDTINEYKQLASNLSVANAGNLIVSDSKDAMSAEVDAMIRNSRSVLDSIPYHEKVMQACDSMLRDLNPQFAKEKQQEEKIDALEGKMIGIESTLSQMMGLLSDAIGQSKSKKNNKED